MLCYAFLPYQVVSFLRIKYQEGKLAIQPNLWRSAEIVVNLRTVEIAHDLEIAPPQLVVLLRMLYDSVPTGQR